MLPIPMSFETISSPSLISTAVFHIDASLPTTSSPSYGYNVLTGSSITELCNLSDISMSSNPKGSASQSIINGATSISLVIPYTPLFTEGQGFTSSLTYNLSTTYSTLFCVSSQVDTGDPSCAIVIVRPNGATSNIVYVSAQSSVWQANKGGSAINGNFDGTYSTGISLIKVFGSTTETAGGTNVFCNGVTWSRVGENILGNLTARGINTTNVLRYYISNTTKGKTMSFHEIIYFDYLLNSSQISEIEDYLKLKWNISY